MQTSVTPSRTRSRIDHLADSVRFRADEWLPHTGVRRLHACAQHIAPTQRPLRRPEPAAGVRRQVLPGSGSPPYRQGTEGDRMTRRCRMPARLRLSGLAAALLLVSAGCTDSSVDQAGPGEATGSTGRATETFLPADPGTTVTIMGAGDVAGDREDAAATAR